MSIFEPTFARGIHIGSTWHVQFSGKQQFPPRDVYDVDLFDTKKETIRQLRRHGIVVICYFSAGTREDWRRDKDIFPSETLGNPVSGWSGENWIDVRNAQVRRIMHARIILAKSKGCDGIDPDNVNGHENDTGFSLSKEDLLTYQRYLIREAHIHSLMIGLKNSQSLIPEIGNKYDFFINESCYTFSECDPYRLVLESKPVLIMEYTDLNIGFCEDAKRYGFTLQYFSHELSGVSRVCP